MPCTLHSAMAVYPATLGRCKGLCDPTIFLDLVFLITVLSVNLPGDGLRNARDPFSVKQVG
jgi:hypothetical protein